MCSCKQPQLKPRKSIIIVVKKPFCAQTLLYINNNLNRFNDKVCSRKQPQLKQNSNTIHKYVIIYIEIMWNYLELSRII